MQEFTGSSPIVMTSFIILFLLAMSYLNTFASSDNFKGGIFMLNLIQSFVNFSISYVSGRIVPVFS